MKTVSINERALLAFGHDVVMLAISWVVTFLLFSLSLTAISAVASLPVIFLLLAVAIPVQACVSIVFGMYQGLWRYASLPDVQRIVASVLAGTLAVGLTVWAGGWLGNLGFAQFFIQTLLLIVLMAGSRISYRSLQEWRQYGKTGDMGHARAGTGCGRRCGEPHQRARSEQRLASDGVT